MFHLQTLLILLVDLVTENTIAIVVNSRFQNEMDFQDVLLNTRHQPTRYLSSLKGIMIVNHRDLIPLISTVRPKTMWGNLHVRVYPQPSGPAYRLSFFFILCHRLAISFSFPLCPLHRSETGSSTTSSSDLLDFLKCSRICTRCTSAFLRGTIGAQKSQGFQWTRWQCSPWPS